MPSWVPHVAIPDQTDSYYLYFCHLEHLQERRRLSGPNNLKKNDKKQQKPKKKKEKKKTPPKKPTGFKLTKF